MNGTAAAPLAVHQPAPGVRLIAIEGQVTRESEALLQDAYERAADGAARAIVLDFSGLEYMNSGGIGLLVTLLVRARRNHQRMLACGLSEHYRQIFELTRLDEVISIYDTAAAAIEAAG
jgi:anti-sigma B factor antagonist